MRTARLLGPSEDGRCLIVVTDTGEHLAIVADARLRAAVRGDRPRLGQLEIEMESALRPREIQTRIRAGHSLAEVAQAAGVPVERVEPYAAPVLAEREHIAALALRSTVRRRGETSGHRNLKLALDERLGARGIDTTDVHWDSARNDDGRWSVTAFYASGEAQRQAVFFFDVTARFSVAGNDEARWVLGEQSPAKGPQPGRRRPVREESDESVASEPTLDLSDELALVRAIQDDPQPPTERSAGPDAGTDVHADTDIHTQQDADDHTQQDADDDAAEDADKDADLKDADLKEDADTDAEDADADAEDVALLEANEIELGQEADEPDGPTMEHPPEQPGLDDIVSPDHAVAAAPADDGPAVPDHTEMDTLYEMLEGYTEDSVRVYPGLDDPPATGAGWEPEIVVNEPIGPTDLDVGPEDPPSDDTSDEEEEQREGIIEPPTTNPDPIDPSKVPGTTGDEDAPAKEDAVPDAPGAPEPRDPDAVEFVVSTPKTAPRKRKRASVPSWDEIMFGGPKPG
ncbi:MAG: septation protein SepH [Propionibacteriaceae bacterium]